ncbi:MAG: hypothetical protein KAI98_05025, partial [Gemmatimonadetes bacterium]|nr:hypothetical protein [Gemmatimonadota bacterium]
AACQPEPPHMSAEANIEADRQAILDLERGLFAAEAAGDLDAWMNFIDDDPVWLPPNQPAIMDDGKSIWIVKRQQDGTWRPSRAIWNSDIPPATSP